MRNDSYPTPAQVSMYIGNMWIDDAYRVEFRKQNPKTPLYGYDEKYFSNVADGHVIVTGNLVINYRYPGYLWNAIAEAGEKMYPERGAYVRFAADLLTMSPSQRIDAIREARQKGGAGLDQISSVMRKIFATPAGSSTRTNVSAPDLVNQMLTDGQGNYNPIDIRIYFDNPQNAWYSQVIRDVHFTGSSMVMSASGQYGGDSSASGQPIFEVFSFFAKNVRPEATTNTPRNETGLANEVGVPNDNLTVVGTDKVSERWLTSQTEQL